MYAQSLIETVCLNRGLEKRSVIEEMTHSILHNKFSSVISSASTLANDEKFLCTHQSGEG